MSYPKIDNDDFYKKIDIIYKGLNNWRQSYLNSNSSSNKQVSTDISKDIHESILFENINMKNFDNNNLYNEFCFF
jgi:hypothetical protein